MAQLTAECCESQKHAPNTGVLICVSDIEPETFV